MTTHIVYITTRDKAEARAIGRYLVTERLAACVNIIDKMNSFYIWEGELQDDTETVMIAKTTEARLDELIEAVKARHSYDCPCVVSIPISRGNTAFLDWIAGQTAGTTSVDEEHPQA